MAEAVWTSTPAGKKQDDILAREKSSPISPVSGSHQIITASKMSPPTDSYWFAHAAEPRGKVRQVPKASPAEKDESVAQEQLSPSHKPYMDKQSDLHLEGVSPVEKLYVPPRAATPSRLDSYWFAHSGIDLSSPTADQASDSGFSDGKESSPPSLQREKKSQQEQNQYFEGRQKQPKQLRIFTAQTDNFQEYENTYKQPKAEQYHDTIKYSVSEEKRSYIWDTKETKEDNMKLTYEQEAKLEARRNAQRNHLSFAFGNSTQESLSDDRSNINGHPGYQGSEVIFPIIRHIDERDVHDDKRNDMSSYNLIQKIGFSPQVNSDLQQYEKTHRKRKSYPFASNQTKECLTWSDNVSVLKSSGDNDCMSRSMIITSTARGRRKTDLVPVVPSSRNTFSRMPSPGNQAKRSVSMTRLDQLAQPRRHYVEARQEMGKNASSSGSHSFASSMSKSMYNVDSHVPVNRKMLHVNSMSKSMLHLASHQSLTSSSNFSLPNPQLCSASSLKNSKRLSQSMMHLNVMPRPTRASLLRAEALATAREKGLSSSMLLLNRNDAFGSRLSLAPAVRKEPSQSPARPRSSLAATAEVVPEKSQTPKVTMRSKPKTRPRPVSIAGTVPDQPPKASTPMTKEQIKPQKRAEKKGPATAAKPPSAKVTSLPATSEELPSQKVPESPVLEEEGKESITPESHPLPSQPDDSAVAAESPVIQTESTPESSKDDEMSTSLTKSRIISEEEAKAALQEKRRLAREQAEREAELERIRQEEIRRQEEEQKRKEEEEQRRQEEEQLKLMAELQRQEEEKLKKAIEEREKREEEERLRQEEENRLKAEKEEQERIAREEAERQRIELAERLKREEEERAERKRRVEQIMSRTRGRTGNQQSDTSSDKSQVSSTPLEAAAKLTASGHLPSSVLSALSSIHGGSLIKGKTDNASDNNNTVTKASSKIQETENNKHQSIVHTDSKRETDLSQHSVSTDGIRSQEDNINLTADFDQGVTVVLNNMKESDKVSCDKAGNIDSHHQTNGYSDDNERERSSNGLSHGRSETSTSFTDTGKVVQPSQSGEIIDSNLEQVIQLEDSVTRKTSVQVDDNLLNNVEDVNSNTVPGTPIVAFEEVRQPQASITG